MIADAWRAFVWSSVFSIAFRVSEKLHKALFGKFLGALFDRLSCLIKRLQEALLEILAKRAERLI